MLGQRTKYKLKKDFYPLSVKFTPDILGNTENIEVMAFCPDDDMCGMTITEAAFRGMEYKYLMNRVKQQISHTLKRNILNDFLNGEHSRTKDNVIISTLVKEDDFIPIIHPKQYSKLLHKDYFEIYKYNWKEYFKNRGK